MNISNDEYLKAKEIVILYEKQIKALTYKCMLCGRDKFTSKQPHKCRGGFRKRKIVWKINELKDESNNSE